MMEDLERKVSFKGDKDDKGEGEENGNSHNRSENPPPSPPPANIRSSSPNVRGSVAKSPNFQARSLRENLMREQRDRDPLFYYEVIQTLGVGSMGSVAKVKKRAHLVGGSARASIQQAVRRQKKERECLKIPIIGGIFRFCLDGKLKESRSLLDLVSVGKGQSRNRLDTGNSTTSSILQINAPDFFTTGSASTDDSIRSLGSSTGKSSIISSTSNTYAMKSIHLSRVTEDSFITELKNEIDILKKLDHPHIVRAIETFEHRNQIFIVMELCQGGDLYSRDPYTEEDAARIVSSVLSAIAYMHSKGITHRDLKFENILFVNESEKSECKIIDFGLSKVYGDNAQLTDGVGTIYTMAPEVLKGNYTPTADVWSIGVISFMLLSSQMPFYGRKRRDIVEQILECRFDFRGRRWRNISDQAKEFIRDLLVLDPKERFSAEEALAATWLNRRFAATTRAAAPEEEDQARTAMLRYAGYTKLKKMALMIVAHKSNSEEIGILRKLFKKFDSRGDGSISYEEFCLALEESGLEEEDMKSMFEAVDLDGSGRIRYTEFLAATIEAQGAISEERLAEAFDRLDSDDSGYIDADNLAEILGKDFPREEIEEIIREADLSKDNRISYSEFLALWENKHENARQEQIAELGIPLLSMMDLSMHLDAGSNVALDSQYVDNAEVAEARANFIHEKHKPDSEKHVAFTDTLVQIGGDNSIRQQVLDASDELPLDIGLPIL